MYGYIYILVTDWFSWLASWVDRVANKLLWVGIMTTDTYYTVENLHAS